MVTLTYLAGFFDGEGSLGIYRKTKGYHLKVQLAQNIYPESTMLFEEITAQYGGTLGVIGGKKYNWQISAVKAKNFLEVIVPHLKLKRESRHYWPLSGKVSE